MLFPKGMSKRDSRIIRNSLLLASDREKDCGGIRNRLVFICVSLTITTLARVLMA